MFCFEGFIIPLFQCMVGIQEKSSREGKEQKSKRAKEQRKSLKDLGLRFTTYNFEFHGE